MAIAVVGASAAVSTLEDHSGEATEAEAEPATHTRSREVPPLTRGCLPMSPGSMLTRTQVM